MSVRNILFIFWAVFSFQCLYAQEDNHNIKVPSAFGQDWEKFEKAGSNGMPNAQIEILDRIIELALQQKNAPELYLALSQYSVTVSATLKDPEDKQNILAKFETMPDKLEAPYSNIVHGFLAEQYQQFFSYWGMTNWGEDFSVPCLIDGKVVYYTKDYDVQQTVKKYHYLKSLENPEVLFQQKSMDYANSLYVADSSFFLKSPALYDLLAEKSLGYFSVFNRSFRIAFDRQWYASTEEFLKKGSNDMLNIYSQQETFHWKSANLTAYTEHTLARLQYVRGLDKGKDNKLYLEALHKLRARLNGHPATLGVICREADVLLGDQANRYHWKDNPAAKDKAGEIHDMVAAALKQQPASAYIQDARAILQGIESRKINIQFQHTQMPGKANLMTVDYQNVQEAFLTVYHIDRKNMVKDWDREDNILRGEKHKVHAQKLVLDMNGKFNDHSKDFIIPPLKETGQYLFLITSTPDSADIIVNLDDYSHASMAYAILEMHAISVIHNFRGDGAAIAVLDQLTGNPVAGAAIYISDSHGKSHKLGETDKAGEFSASFSEERSFKVIYQNDSIEQYIYTNNYMYPEDPVSYRIITDRSIYRPGQTVNFKVYAFEGKSPGFKVVSKHETELSFLDYEGVTLGSVSGYTNEFGTFAGSFVLPRTGKTGPVSMSINSTAYLGNITVEEYKRPSFEVEAKYDKTAYKLGDRVTVSGKVKAYSGYGLGDSKVHVKISYAYGYRYYYSSEPLLDTVIMSNKQGEFSLSFLAKTKNEDGFGASFSYDISATSMAGETQVASGSLFIGKFRPEWEVTVPAQVLSDQMSFAKIAVSSEQKLYLDGEQKPAPPKIEVELWKSNPDYVKAEEFFIAHEFQGFTADDFKKQFKNAQYGPAMVTKTDPVTGALQVVIEPEKIPAFTRVATMTIQSGDSLLLNKLVSAKPGRYELHLRRIDGKDTMDMTYSFVYIRMDSKKNQHLDPLWMAASPKNFKPGDEVPVIIGSQYKKQNVLVEIYRGSELLSHQWMKLNGRTKLTYKIKPEDLGGISINAYALHQGQFLETSAYLQVPFESKELKVKLETVREILRPGAQEKWLVSVASKDGSPLSSELAVGMADASLDQFADSHWNMAVYQDNYGFPHWDISQPEYPYFSILGNWDGRFDRDWRLTMNLEGMNGDNFGSFKLGENQNATYAFSVPVEADELGLLRSETRGAKDIAEETAAVKAPEKVRTNFNETAFFYPQLTAQDNRFQFEFTLPDALTRWNFQALAHDKLMRFGYTLKEFTAQKELMVDPNEPRFFRAGDEFILTANLANLTEKEQNVTATLEWFDPYTNVVIPGILGIMPDQQAKLAAQGTQTVSWTLKIPKTGLELIAYRIKVSSPEFSDAEEKVIPVLSNRTQVIESVPVTVEGKGNYVFELPKLLRQNSPTQHNERLVVEYNANPLWSAVMAIPYLTDYPYDCAEQVFSKFFANRISQTIVNDNPMIQKVLSQPGTSNPDLFLSALNTNEDLKAIVLAETPWILEANSETQQKQRIAQLFDMNNLMQQEAANLSKLIEMQHPNGGWSWFAGGTPNTYITQHILSGFGHLSSLGIDMADRIDLGNSLEFLEMQYDKQYRQLKKEQVQKLEGLSALEIQWLYAKQMLGQDTSAASNYYAKCLERDWLKFPLHVQAMAGTYFIHAGQPEMAQKIFRSIQSKATTRKNLGTYWNENQGAYSWDRNAIETQASLIEFFKKSSADEKTLASMKLWLLNQKRGQYWESTKTTAWACYALLIDAQPVMSGNMTEKVYLGGQELTGAAAGYMRKTYAASEIKASMGKMAVEQTAEEPGFGSLNLVYTEEIEKLSKNASGMQIEKLLFLVKDGKETLITPATKLALGDLVRVHLQVTSDRELEFVHVKDLRASGAENVETLSAYRSTGTLYYYNANRDASTEFFLDRLPKGKHTITYDMRISGRGTQSTGYAMVECLYAPEFRANSGSGGIKVE